MSKNYLQIANTALCVGMNMSMSIAISSSISSLYKLPNNAGINRFLDGFIFNYVVDTHIKPVSLSNFNGSLSDNFLYRGLFQFDKYIYNMIAKTLLERQDLNKICKNIVRNDFFIDPCKGAILTGSGMTAFYEVVALEEKVSLEYKWPYVLSSVALAIGITYYIGGIATASVIWSNSNIINGVFGMVASFLAMDLVHLFGYEGYQFEVFEETTIPMMTLAAVSFVSIRSSDFIKSIVTETAKITSFAMAKMIVVVGMEVFVDSYEYTNEIVAHETHSLVGIIMAEEF